jgi:hypothetical protein
LQAKACSTDSVKSVGFCRILSDFQFSKSAEPGLSPKVRQPANPTVAVYCKIVAPGPLATHIAFMTDRGFFLSEQAIGRQLAAMPHDVYLIRLIHNQTRRPLPGQRVWTATQLLDPPTTRFLRARNRSGYDVYIQPHGGDRNAGYILVDLDNPDAGVVGRMRRHGHDPCLVLETSPGHLQAWVQVCNCGLEAFVATAVAKQLARQYGGDPGSADWRHLGRLAGFTNQKPSRRNHHGYAPWVKIVHAHPGLAPNAAALTEPAGNSWSPSSDAADPSPVTLPGSITTAQAEAIYQSCFTQWRITERFRPPDWSIVDLWVSRRLLAQGRPADQVADILQLGSPQFPRRHGNPQQYLRRTLRRAAAFPAIGRTV